MRLYMKATLPIASLFIGLFTVNKLHPIPQIRTASAATITISTKAGPSGDYLVDGQGKSLYVFDKDPPNGSACTGDCALLWPPMTAAAGDTIGVNGNAQSNRVGTPYVRPDGTQQVIYADHPLYYYQGDTQSGDTKGNGLNSFGGRWCLVSPSGSSMCGSAGSTPSSTPTAGASTTPVVVVAPGTGTNTGTNTTPPTQPGTGNGNGTGNGTGTGTGNGNGNGNGTGTGTGNGGGGTTPECGTCTCTLPGQVNCLNSCGQSFGC